MRKDGLEILTPTRGGKQCLYNFVQTEVRTSTTMWKTGCKPAENSYKKVRCRKAWEAVQTTIKDKNYDRPWPEGTWHTEKERFASVYLLEQ